MKEERLRKKVRKAKQIVDRCRTADIDPPKWVVSLLNCKAARPMAVKK